MQQLVIVGAGQAGAAAAAKLRALGFAGSLTLIGAETAPPYQRPPLSKAYLMGEMEEARLWLRAPEFWAEAQITLKLGAAVTAIDTTAQTVRFMVEIMRRTCTDASTLRMRIGKRETQGARLRRARTRALR